jgi:tRNA-splicing ligase RtcB
MAKLKLRGKELIKLGYPEGKVIGLSINLMLQHYKRNNKGYVLGILKSVLEAPQKYQEDPVLGRIASELMAKDHSADVRVLRDEALAYAVYGAEGIEKGAHQQMQIAARLPVAVGGALMADAHHGYGLPIGGVLATRNAVIPYGVGVDIGCRMALSVFPIPAEHLHKQSDDFLNILERNTRFGRNAFDHPLDDPIFGREEFREIDVVKRLKGKAIDQIGSSGGGNHFVEFGQVHLVDEDNEFGLPTGTYLGLLSHSGSRGLGANIARHYTQLAMEACPLPKEAKHLAWLDLDTDLGKEYWAAMTLAGDYASACHNHIHRRIANALGENPLAVVENHHNFAWKEQLADGTEVIVHRKGATPAQKGVLGIIPGSMTAPGFIVRGTGKAEALQSASHGAGRQMSRTQAKNSVTRNALKKELADKGVILSGGGLDEAPIAYKDIREVMRAQQDLVDVVGTFTPRIVRMADD